MREKKVLKDCLSYLKAKGIFAWRNNTGAGTINGRFLRFGSLGSPDILGILDGGRLLCVECKSEKGQLTANQEVWLGIAKQLGAMVFVVRSVDELKTYIT